MIRENHLFAAEWSQEKRKKRWNLEHTYYREVKKGLYVVARNFFLLLLNGSAQLCLDPA